MNADQIIQSVRQYLLQTHLPGEDPANLTPTTELLSSGILDSLATLELVSFLEKQFAITLEAHEVDASNLGTLSAIATMVQSKLGARV
ncbi:MAG: acyl carrier protein [Gemmatimonadota bacterium]|nr:acyl carrier protein [Gemmatimonadota bacterium]